MIKEMQKISNNFLLKIIEIAKNNISLSVRECAEKIDFKATTLYNWHSNLKKGKWPKNYSKTEDKMALEEEIVNQFISCFAFSNSSSRILRRMVSKKCLQDKYCYAKQHKILKRLFEKYPNINFWLNVDFGDPRDDILFYIGKNEQNLHKKYLDFTKEDSYTEFEYKYKPEENTPKTKTKKNLWDFY